MVSIRKKERKMIWDDDMALKHAAQLLDGSRPAIIFLTGNIIAVGPSLNPSS